jgi:hypothetical protein
MLETQKTDRKVRGYRIAATGFSLSGVTTMRICLKGLVCLWAFFQCGCAIGNKITIGQKPSAETLEFLKLPDASRQEVIATLGKPYFESETNRILVYIWEETLEMHPLVDHHPATQDAENSSTASLPSNNLSENQRLGNQTAETAKEDTWKELRQSGTQIGHEVAREILKSDSSSQDSLTLGKPQSWGLFIAYDENGEVTAYTALKTEFDQAIIEKKCAIWRENGTKININFKVIQVEQPPSPPTRR